MKLTLRQLVCLAMMILTILLAGCNTVPGKNGATTTQGQTAPWESTPRSESDAPALCIIPEELGSPYKGSYGKNEDAKNVWDMIVYDGKLFLGSGDYNLNSGCRIACYDLSEHTWTLQKIPDEEANEFCIINGDLIAPGIDPKSDWSMGNYYVYRDGKWKPVRTIPGGLHNFCMVECDGLLFAGLGVLEGQTPVACSADGGKSFVQVPFYKDGEPWCVEHSNEDRAYVLFVLHGRVYALLGSFGNRLFCYEDGCFEYVTDWEDEISYQVSLGFPRGCFFETVTYQDTLYFTTGHLFKVSDVQAPVCIDPDEGMVCDLYVEGDVLYVLTSRKDDEGNYINSVYSMNDSGCELLFCFADKLPAVSFAVNGSDFYFSLRYQSFIDPERSGCVLKYSQE